MSTQSLFSSEKSTFVTDEIFESEFTDNPWEPAKLERDYWPGEDIYENPTEFEKIVILKEQELFDLSDDDLLRFLDTIPPLYEKFIDETFLPGRDIETIRTPINKSDFDFRTNRFKTLRNCVQFKLEDKKKEILIKREQKQFNNELYDDFRTFIRTITSENESQNLINYDKNRTMFIDLLSRINGNS